LAQNKKVGELNLRLSLKVGKQKNYRETEISLSLPMWLSMKKPELWFKSYDRVLTNILSQTFTEFEQRRCGRNRPTLEEFLKANTEFELQGWGQNRDGYYAKFASATKSYAECFRIIERLREWGYLTVTADLKKLQLDLLIKRLKGD